MKQRKYDLEISLMIGLTTILLLIFSIDHKTDALEHTEEQESFEAIQQTPNDLFIQEIITEDNIRLAKRSGIKPSVMFAQAILESNWGRSDLARINNNIFGYKGLYKGFYGSEFPTLEDNGYGGLYEVNAIFRLYPSTKESLEDYLLLVTNSRYQANLYESPEDQIWQIWSKGYATDTQYVNKILNIIETWNLKQYDI